jgi:hypothetical protein
MPTVAVIALLALASTIVSSSIIATWILSAKLGTVKSDLIAEIALLKTDIAVLKKSEESRDEKINRMWEWWMSALEHGWMGFMTSQEKRAVKEL